MVPETEENLRQVSIRIVGNQAQIWNWYVSNECCDGLYRFL